MKGWYELPKEVEENNDVVQLFEDDVFFRKDQITVGTRLTYMGRSDTGAVWEVYRIYSFDRKKGKDVRVEVCKRLKDEVQIRRVSNTKPPKRHGKQMFMSFQYFSY